MVGRTLPRSESVNAGQVWLKFVVKNCKDWKGCRLQLRRNSSTERGRDFKMRVWVGREAAKGECRGKGLDLCRILSYLHSHLYSALLLKPLVTLPESQQEIELVLE